MENKAEELKQLRTEIIKKHLSFVDDGSDEMKLIFAYHSAMEEYASQQKPEIAKKEESKLVILDGVNNECYPVKTFQEFIDFAKEFNDDSEGIHPDIESIELYQRVGHIELIETSDYAPNENGEQMPICKIEFVNELKTRIQSSDLQKEVERLKDVLKLISYFESNQEDVIEIKRIANYELNK